MKAKYVKKAVVVFMSGTLVLTGSVYAGGMKVQAEEKVYTGDEISVNEQDETKIAGRLVDLAKQKDSKATKITLGKEVTAVISSFEDYYDSGNDVAVKNNYRSLVRGFPKLKSIAVESGNSVLQSKQGILYTFYGKQVTACPLQKNGAVRVAEGTEKIDVNAFVNCKKITSIFIPKSVTKIDEGAFGNNTACKKFTVAKGNKKYKAVDGVLYTKDKKTLVAYPSGRTKKSFTIPKGVTKIAAAAFMGNTKLEKITFSSSLKTVGNSAFSGAKRLKTVNAKSKVKTLVAGAFYQCKKLSQITFRKKGLKDIYADCFTGCKKLAITIPKSAAVDQKAGLEKAKSIKCYVGSGGESYCKANKIKYKLVDL